MAASVPSFKRLREPTVLSPALIRESIEAEERKVLRSDVDSSTFVPTPPQEALALRLSFRRLTRVENLHPLMRLLELRLDNNSLANLDGLQHLKHLRVLDVSFNRIASLESGQLDFPELTELSLFNNELRTMSGLKSGVPRLELLSLGNNSIGELKDVLHLRGMKRLRALTLDGNPICGASRNGYRHFCIAFLPHLRFLDAQLITLSEQKSSREGGVDAELLSEIEERDLVAARESEKEAEAEGRRATLAACNAEVAVTLMGAMASADPEYARWRTLQGAAQAAQEMETQCKTAGNALAATGVEKSRAADAEVDAFAAAARQLIGLTEGALRTDSEAWERTLKRATRGEELGTDASAPLQADELPDGLVALARAISDRAVTAELRAHESIDVSSAA